MTNTNPSSGEMHHPRRRGIHRASSLLRTGLAFALGLSLPLSACGPAQNDDADLVLTGGKVVTVDPTVPEAEAVAVRDGRIAAVGSASEIASWIGPDTRVVDLDGKLALPGFIEGHAHYMRVGAAQLELDLTEATSWEEIVSLAPQSARSYRRGARAPHRRCDR